MSIFQNIGKAVFGSSNDRYVKSLGKIVDQINALEPAMQALSDDELKAQTVKFQDALNAGGKLDDILPEAFATVREASVRVFGMRHFDVQLIGGMVLHQGNIAEMKTGEGKTLVATLALYLNALEGKGAHLVTVNDYLAKRDTQWMGPIYHALGLSVGCLQHNASHLFDPETEGILRSRQIFTVSTDEGESWGQWQLIPTPGLTGCATTGPAIKWPDGAIAHAFESFKEFDDPEPSLFSPSGCSLPVECLHSKQAATPRSQVGSWPGDRSSTCPCPPSTRQSQCSPCPG